MSLSLSKIHSLALFECEWLSVWVLFFLSSADARIRDYPLMHNPIEMSIILVAYIFFSVYAGPRLMANRKPFSLKIPMIVYNLSMVLLNAYIVLEVRKKDDKLSYSLTQNPNGRVNQDVLVRLMLIASVVVFLKPSSCCPDGPPPIHGDVT